MKKQVVIAVPLIMIFALHTAAAPQPGQDQLTRRVAPDAGSTNAPLLFCIGMHIEPLGATPSRLIPGSSESVPRPGPSYERLPLFERHVADIRRVAEIVEQAGGKLTVQAQTPFTRMAAETGDPLLGELEKRGHEMALHFHEDAHLGRGSERLDAATWTAVMKEELDWLRLAGATRLRYWSGGNLYPGVLDAAAAAGLTVMSDYKNPRRQDSDARLLAIHPWRPAGGPTDLDAFARHAAQGKIIYLPDGLFSRTDHAAMRRSEELGGDWRYFDFLTAGLEQSLRAARSDRVNVFHFTVHAGEFRGREGAAFAVIDAWLREVLAPLVKAGKVRWATFSQMAGEYAAWEQAHPGVNPRGDAAPADTNRGYMTFAVNVHDWRFVDESADTVLRLVGLFEKHGVRGDFYFTAPLVERYAEKRPDVIERLKKSGMTISYHVRAPHPLWRGFSGPLRDKSDDELAAVLRDYEQFRLDLRTGELDRNRPGGYRYVEQVFGGRPVAVGASDAAPDVKAISARIYAGLGARVAVFNHETGTKIDRPFEFHNGLLARPSDFSVTRFAGAGNGGDVFWWNMQGTPRAAEFDPVALLNRQLAAWQGPRPPFVTALIHENDFYRQGGPGWNAIYFEGEGQQARPRRAPFDLDTPPRPGARTPEVREAIFAKYEELILCAAGQLNIITSADVAKMADAAGEDRRSDRRLQP